MKRKLMVWLAGACAAGLLTTPGAVLGAGHVNDSTIRTTIERKFHYDDSVPMHRIDVGVDGGKVTLTGTVGNLQQRERAERIAEALRGVREVKNQIVVTTSVLSDRELQKNVEEALWIDPATDSYEIKPAVIDGVVTLTGEVDSWQERRLAGFVVAGVNGVNEVKNRVKVDYNQDRNDLQIREDIEGSIALDVHLTGEFLDVEVQEGHVTISGTVNSQAMRTRAYAKGWVTGVDSVDVGGIKIADVPPVRRATKAATKRTDEGIAYAVRVAYARNPRLSGWDADISVLNGAVTLTGRVNHLKARQEAEREARDVAGVRRVYNYLKVQPEQVVSDKKLEANVRKALKRDSWLHDSGIEVEADAGMVVLEGSVDGFFEKAQARDVVSRVKGVAAVRNNLEIENEQLTYYNMEWSPAQLYMPYYYTSASFGTKTDREIREDILDELFWSPFVDSEDIVLKVEDGVATLSGRVDSWSELRTAAENAREGGAVRVINKLAVRDGDKS